MREIRGYFSPFKCERSKRSPVNMSHKVKLRMLILFLVVIVQRTTVISGQQEEKFFYNADFKDSDQQGSQTRKSEVLPVFPDGPLHVSLGLRALSGDNRPQFSEAVASSNAQVLRMCLSNLTDNSEYPSIRPKTHLNNP